MHSSRDYITCEELAFRLGITPRAVRQRATEGAWPGVHQKIRGGRRKVYLISGLPEDVRAKLQSHRHPGHGPGTTAGAGRAEALTRENEAARLASRQEKEAQLAAFARLSEENQHRAEARLEILKARDAFVSTIKTAKKRGTALFIREYQAGRIGLDSWIDEQAGTSKAGRASLSWATLYRWEKTYAQKGLVGLAGNIGATRATAITKPQKKFIEAMLVKFPHVSMTHIENAMTARFDGQKIPSIGAIRRYVAAWKKQNASLFLYITDPDAWRGRHQAAFGRADESTTRLNQLWEFDSTPADVLLKDGRHTIIGAIDVYSRRGMLQVSPTSRASAIAALTRRALLSWGVPEVAKTDNGTDYVSNHLVRIFEALGIEQRLCPPFTPEKKPHIERFFGTFARDIVELLPGYIGHSVAERKSIEARRSFAQRLMDATSDPIAIDMTAEEFQEICNRWCEAVYEHNRHAGLAGKTPAQMAAEWAAPVHRIENARALDILLLPAPDGDGTRLVTKKGVKVENSYFIAPELATYIGERVFVLIDQADYGTIYVFLIEENGGKTYLCTAVDPLRTGHDRGAIADLARNAQKEFMASARKELKRAANEVAVDAIGKEILSFRESQRANVREFPRQSVNYSTAQLDQAALAVEDIKRQAAGPLPYAITQEEEAAAGELVEMAARREARPLPATPQEKYEQLNEDLCAGVDVPDADLAWMKRYELWLETGERMAL